MAVSPSSVYRVLKQAGVLDRGNAHASKKGTGFVQPLAPHEHWHVDISYINVARHVLLPVQRAGRLQPLHRPLGDAARRMKEADVETIVQRAREKFPGATPRIITDNGPQFIAKDFKEFIRLSA